MSDIVQRLRELCTETQAYQQRREAADEIERLTMELRAHRQDNGAVIAGLQNEIERLRAALEVLAEGIEPAARVVARRALEGKCDDARPCLSSLG